jgi:hypothetical protein
MGLGSFNTVSLADARVAARQCRKALLEGKDPIDARRDLRQQAKLDAARPRVASKIAAFADQSIEPKGYLYRHYGPDGDLLYVGQAMSALKRNAEHLSKADWRNFIYMILVEPFATREEALAAEAEAIRVEYPKHNTIHNIGRHPLRELRRLQKASA